MYLYAEIARHRALETRRVGERRALVFIIFTFERPSDNDPPLRGNGAAKSHRRLESWIGGEHRCSNYSLWGFSAIVACLYMEAAQQRASKTRRLN